MTSKATFWYMKLRKLLITSNLFYIYYKHFLSLVLVIYSLTQSYLSIPFVRKKRILKKEIDKDMVVKIY